MFTSKRSRHAGSTPQGRETIIGLPGTGTGVASADRERVNGFSEATIPVAASMGPVY